MSGEHYTPGPLTIFVDNRAPDDINLMSGDFYVAVLVGGAGAPEKRDNALDNARRMAACWNACIGIPTASLEEDGVMGMKDALKGLKP